MQIETTLSQLETTQLVRRFSEEEATYMFKHALTQDAAYQSLLLKQRREIHRCVAQAYEDQYGDQCLDEHAAILAHHFAEAGDDAQALIFTHRAGDHAARLNAHAEAIAYYSRALEMTAHLGASSRTAMQELYLKRGRIFELNSQHDLALANYEEMETRARERGNRALELAASIARATIYSIPSQYFDVARAKRLCDQALTLARQLGDEPAQAKILWNMLLLNTRLGTNYREGIGYGEQAIAIARRLDLREQLAYLLNDLGLPLIWSGEIERGTTYNLEARQMWRDLNNLPMLTDNLNYAAMGFVSLGEYNQAIASAGEALEISRRIGNHWGETFSQSWVGEAYRELGLIDQAIITMENSIRLAESGFQPPLAFTRADLAVLFGDLGQVARGIELAHLAKTAGEKIAPVMFLYATAQLAHLYLLANQIAFAGNLISDILPRLSSTDDGDIFSMAIKLTQAELALAQTDYPRAILASEHLLAAQHMRHLPQLVPNALHLKGLALQRLGQVDKALITLNEARAEAERANSRWMLWRILATLAEIEETRDNHNEAQTLKRQAREMIDFIVAHTPEEFRASFLNLSKVRNVLEN